MYKTEIINEDYKQPCFMGGKTAIKNGYHLYCNGVYIIRADKEEDLGAIKRELELNGWCIHHPSTHFLENPFQVVDILVERKAVFEHGSRLEKETIDGKTRYSFRGNMSNLSFCFSVVIIDEKYVNDLLEYIKSNNKLTNLQIRL